MRKVWIISRSMKAAFAGAEICGTVRPAKGPLEMVVLLVAFSFDVMGIWLSRILIMPERWVPASMARTEPFPQPVPVDRTRSPMMLSSVDPPLDPYWSQELASAIPPEQSSDSIEE
jgi:hypothetical protein